MNDRNGEIEKRTDISTNAPGGSENGRDHPRATLPRSPFIYAILDRAIVAPADIAAVTSTLVAGGIELIQYRAKRVSRNERLADLRDLLPAAASRSVPVIVNDDPALAAEAGAHGVHLGAHDAPPCEARRILGPDRIIGVTVHSVRELEEIDLDLLDYIAVGAIYPSPTKPGVPAVGLAFLERIRTLVSCTLVAIGGIDERTIEAVFDRGADGVALVSALLSGDIGKKCFTFRSIVDTRRTAAG